MLENCHKLQWKPKTINELKVALQNVWEELPQEHINKEVANFTKRFTACEAAKRGQSISKFVFSSQHQKPTLLRTKFRTTHIPEKDNFRNAQNHSLLLPKVVQLH